MRAVVINGPGGVDVLTIGEREVREPGPGEIRIRMAAAAVNPADVAVRLLGSGLGAPGQQPPPWTPGMDLSGVVEAVGPDVPAERGLQPGRRVAAVVLPDRPEGGAQAELVVVPHVWAVPVPDGLGDVEAAAVPMNGLSARMALDLLDLRPGQVLGVVGAAGVLGGYAVQLAKLAGLRVVAVARPDDEALLRDLGADDVVHRSDDVAAALRAVVPDGVDGLLDGAVLDAAAAGAVRDGGAFASVRGWAGPAERGIRVAPVLIWSYAAETAKLAEVVDLAATGRLAVRVADVLPLAEVAEAHRRLEAGGLRGRLVLTA